MFTRPFEETAKHPYTVANCPFCSQYVFPGAYPKVIGHEQSMWCDNCEKEFKLDNAERPPE